jgi:erythromycin esterase-like protein
VTGAHRIAAAAHEGFEPIVEEAAAARFVLIGDGTHGTDEFYGERAALTRRLIDEHGFDGGTAERKHVRPALAGSYEHLFHSVGLERFTLRTSEVADVLRRPQLERAIGVIYRPETERSSHYFHARLADQFDVVVHLDETHALEPLEPTSEWERGEAPETYPTAL